MGSEIRGGAAPTTSTEHSGWRHFLRLWFVLGFTYSLLKFVCDIAVAHVIDLRPVTFWQLLLVPAGQAAVLYWIGRHTRP